MDAAMTVSVVLGLALQLAALGIMRWAVQGNWVRHTGALLLLVAVAYHGATEVVQALFPGRNPYRLYVTQEQIDRWVVLVSVALLVYAVAYALALGRRHRGLPASPVSVEGLSLKWFALVTLPLALLALQGFAFQAGNGGRPQASVNDYLVAGLVVQFVVLLLAVCSALAIIRFGAGWALLILLAASALIATVGARSMVVIAAVMALYGAALAGVRIPRKQLVGAVVVVALLGMTISATRAVEGRTAFAADAEPGERIAALGAGLAALPTAEGMESVLNDFVYRLDGNMFGARVLSALDRGAEPVGMRTVENNVRLAIPSFLDPDKLRTSTLTRNEKDYFAARFGLPSTSQTDVLPTLWGTMVGYGGPAVLVVLSLLLGLAVGSLDRWGVRRTTPSFFVLGLGVVQFVLSYERGWQAFFVGMRGVLVLVGALLLIHAFRRILLARGRTGEPYPGPAEVGEERPLVGAAMTPDGRTG